MVKLVVGLGRFLPLCALLLVLPSLMHPDIAFAQKLTVAINPAQGSPGTSVTGTGTIGTINTGVFIGKPGDRIEVSWDDASHTTLANTTVRSDGSFSVSFTVPANATSGAHTIIFNDLSAGTSYVLGSPTFTIGQSSLPPPPSASPGQSPLPTPTASQLPPSPPPPLPPPGQSSLPLPPPPTSQPTPPPSNLPNAQHGIILSITQDSSTDITMEVAFDNFAAYRSPFQDHDCFNDGNEYHELYNADTGSLVVSSPKGAGSGIGYCGTFFQTTGNNWLHFLPILLPTGNYWVHYHGTKVGDPAGYDWVTDNFSYFASQPTGKAPNLIVLVHGCCTDENDVVQDWGNGTPNKPGMAKAIADNIPSQTKKDWEIVVWDWTSDTPKRDYSNPFNPVLNWFIIDANKAYDAVSDQNGQPGQGSKLKDAIAGAINKSSINAYEYIHLIGHSAGAKLIHEASQKLAEDKNLKKRPFIHLTFLDAYTRTDEDSGKSDRKGYGFYSNYAEHYVDRGLASTDACLASAFNFNISNWSHSPLEEGLGNHQWPRHWYQKSVTSTSPKFKYGFHLSLEGGNNSTNSLSTQLPPRKQCDLSTLFNENPDCQQPQQGDCWQ